VSSFQVQGFSSGTRACQVRLFNTQQLWAGDRNARTAEES
jgi:hypothetical protein